MTTTHRINWPLVAYFAMVTLAAIAFVLAISGCSTEPTINSPPITRSLIVPQYPPHHEHETASGVVDERHGSKEAWTAKLDREFLPHYHFPVQTYRTNYLKGSHDGGLVD